MNKLKDVIETLIKNYRLPEKYREHFLTWDYKRICLRKYKKWDRIC